ncbi:hypothetical protein BDY19DRAFT_350293 [Irpex rosettiformis]|uniref:Uncharacterized protein n=1 Tax=Irpex rosettiformis TaxID=378272 RepID=A0ACB8TWY5_9APHY|nr:hypothetical protein BDY19DRAFT_350293 [Irpex rosettiformis]
MTARSQKIIQIILDGRETEARSRVVVLVRPRTHSPEKSSILYAQRSCYSESVTQELTCTLYTTPPGNNSVYTGCVLCASDSTSLNAGRAACALRGYESPYDLLPLKFEECCIRYLYQAGFHGVQIKSADQPSDLKSKAPRAANVARGVLGLRSIFLMHYVQIQFHQYAPSEG